MRDWHQSRRDVLKRLGLGAACLPLLRAQRGWGAPAPRKRVMVIEMVNGLRQQAWKPATGLLATQTLPPTAAAFDAVKDAMVFLPDLTNPGLPNSGTYLFGVMFYGRGAAPNIGFYREPDGPTFDQVMARALPAAGGRPSLALGVQPELMPHATTMPGGNYCFWSGAGQPIRPQADPMQVYRDLFSGPSPGDTEARRLLARRKSILDYVSSDLDEFRARSGTEDRVAISAHMESIRGLEQQLQAPAQMTDACASAAPAMIDLAAAASYAPILKAHLGLMVAALKCGITNVATLQTSDALGMGINFGAFVPGVPARGTGYKTAFRNWADLGNNPVLGGVDHKQIVDRWFCDRFAETLAQMRDIDEGGVSMLDTTVMLIGNNMQEGANKVAQKVPWMVGGGGSYLKTGQCPDSAGHSTGSVLGAISEALGVQHQYGVAFADLKK
jgi:hypothetical protein